MRRLHLFGRTVPRAALFLALLCFLLPFLAVSCSTPGGYGQVSQGGTTNYTGVELATGGAPDVSADQLRPAGERRDDRLGWQPLTGLAAVLVLGGLAVNLGLRRRRGIATAGAAAAAGVVLIGGQLTARAELVGRVAEQTALPRAEAEKYVATQYGFWFCLLLLLIAVIAALLQARGESQRRPGPAPPRDG